MNIISKPSPTYLTWNKQTFASKFKGTLENGRVNNQNYTEQEKYLLDLGKTVYVTLNIILYLHILGTNTGPNTK